MAVGECGIGKELLPIEIVCLLLRHDHNWLSSWVVLDTIGYWRFEVDSRDQSEERREFSEKLHRIGQALDPATKGNARKFGEELLFEYDWFVKFFKGVQNTINSFRPGPVQNVRVRIADLVDTGEYNWWADREKNQVLSGQERGDLIADLEEIWEAKPSALAYSKMAEITEMTLGSFQKLIREERNKQEKEENLKQ
jgi:hypothetical protein